MRKMLTLLVCVMLCVQNVYAMSAKEVVLQEENGEIAEEDSDNQEGKDMGMSDEEMRGLK